MKQLTTTVLIMLTSLIFTSCTDDDTTCENTVEKKQKLVTTKAKTIELKTTANGEQSNPTKQTGDFIKFSFKEGKTVTSDDWDFGVRGRLFITNGKKTKDAPNIFGKNEPKRTKEVQVSSLIGHFEDIKDIGGLVKTDWHKDYDYAPGEYNPTAPAIAFESHTRNSSESRQPWHLRTGKDRNKLILRPIVFLFQTQDNHVTKMVIEKIKRTNTNLDKKEDITYTIKYYYNPNDKSVSLDENK